LKPRSKRLSVKEDVDRRVTEARGSVSIT